MKCPSCMRNGGLTDDRNAFGRRQCRFCRWEEPRECDRLLYLACECSIKWDHDDMRRQHRLDGPMSVVPFFSREEAIRFLDERMARWDEEEWGRITVMGHAGRFVYGRGRPTFLFVDEKLVDVRPLNL